MPFCTACGKQNPDDARFCSQCGTRLVRGESPSPPSQSLEESTATITFGLTSDKVETSDRQLNAVDAAAEVVWPDLKVKAALEPFELPVLSTHLCQRVLYAESAAQGLAVVEVAPNGEAAKELAALALDINHYNETSQKVAA